MATDASPSIRTAPPKLGYLEYCCFPDDGWRHEIVDGDHVMTPAPSTTHQTVSKRLQYQLYSQVELGGLGLVFNAPVDVQLTDHDIVQPDLVVVLKDRAKLITDANIDGPPDLVVEILSPLTLVADTARNKQLYERTGVGEYWVADPDNRRVDQFRLVDGRYEAVPPADPLIACGGGLRVRLADLW